MERCDLITCVYLFLFFNVFFGQFSLFSRHFPPRARGTGTQTGGGAAQAGVGGPAAAALVARARCVLHTSIVAGTPAHQRPVR